MPTVHDEDGFYFRFYSNDHLPMHIHVIKGGELCVFFLGEIEEVLNEAGEIELKILEEPSIRENHGMKPANVRRALKIAQENQVEMIAAWHKHMD